MTTYGLLGDISLLETTVKSGELIVIAPPQNAMLFVKVFLVNITDLLGREM